MSLRHSHLATVHMKVLSCRKENHVSKPNKPGWNRNSLCKFMIYDAGHLTPFQLRSILRAFSVCGWNWNWIFFDGLQNEKLSSFGILQSPWEDWKSYAAHPFLSPKTWCFLSHLIMHSSGKVCSEGKLDRESSGCSPSESSKTSSCSYTPGKRLLQLSCGSSLFPGGGLCQVLRSF